MDEEVLNQIINHQNNLNEQLCLPSNDFTGTDFSDFILDNVDFRHSILTDCKMPKFMRNSILTTCSGNNVDFSNTDLTGTIFYTSDVSGFNFVGSFWGGTTLPANPVRWDDIYWVMQTDVFIEVGCQSLKIEDLFKMTDEQRSYLDKNNPENPNIVFYRNKDRILEIAENYAKLRSQK
jgi:hypothetical protein